MSITELVAEPKPLLPHSERRIEQIRRLEDLRQSRVIVYIDQANPGPVPQLLRHLFEHLRDAHGRPHDRVSLLVSRGDHAVAATTRDAELDTAQRAMALLRESAREIEVLVPGQALGAATYFAIGADRIFMHPLGTLGRVAGAGGLAITQHFQALLDEAGATETARAEAVMILADELGAETLAEAHYGIARLRRAVQDLVAGRFQRRQEAQNQALFEALSDPSCPLTQLLDRRRVKEVLALPVENTDPELAAAMAELHQLYETGLRRDDDAGAVVLESAQYCHVWSHDGWEHVTAAQFH